MTRTYSFTSLLTTRTQSVFPWSKRYSSSALMLILSTFALIVMPSCLEAAQVSFAWDANSPFAEEYRLYQRLENQNYDFSAPVWRAFSSASLTPTFTR